MDALGELFAEIHERRVQRRLQRWGSERRGAI